MNLLERRTNPYHGIYFNGLERTGEGIPEKLLLGSLRMRGVHLTHGLVDWHGSDFSDIFVDALNKTREGLDNFGRFAIIGASMGSNLGANVYHEIKTQEPETSISFIGISGWNHVYDDDLLIKTSLHRPGKKPSQAAVNSVYRSEAMVTPFLNDNDRHSMRTIIVPGDDTVPHGAQGFEDVEQYIVGGSNHVRGIVRGMMKVPKVLDDIHQR